MDLNVWQKQLHSGPIDWIKDVFRNMKWSHQRIKNGFSHRDTWNLDYYLLALIPATLETLAEQAHGYPEEYGSHEKWQAELRRVATLFREADLEFYTEEEPCPDVHKYIRREEKKLPDGSVSVHLTFDHDEQWEANREFEAAQQKLRQEKANEAFAWLAEHLYSLWD